MRKSLFFYLFSVLFLISCSSSRKTTVSSGGEIVTATLDLVNVQNDKVNVTVSTPSFTSSTVTYQFAKIIPGTYAIADYGRYVEEFRAYDKSGNTLPVSMKDSNSWVISNANSLARITYKVNDTYDSETGDAFAEGSKTIFSPAGTNILAGKQFMLNMCGFVGYFNDKANITYKLVINHPENLQASSSLDDTDPAKGSDVFLVSRYAEVVDHPIMYASPDIASSRIGNMDLILSIYSPRNKNISTKVFMPDLEKMIRAQKAYLGSINNTKKYAVLTYISSNAKDDAHGFGALEHNTSTTAVFGDNMKSKELIHVISHEFFHTLTPLNVHSKEIQDFDFNSPKMSAHLWMYEGFTEYFANHFQVHQGLMTEEQFYAKMAEKDKLSKQMYSDKQSFTEMSKNVLDPTMKAQYPNVYQKGALMAMCMDIMLREASGGQKGILELMGRLSNKYGPTKPFDDKDLIPEITAMTNPEVGAFLQEHVVKGTPIDYELYLKRVGVSRAVVKEPTLVVFMSGKGVNLKVDTVNKKAIAVMPDATNSFMTSMGIQDGDELIEINGSPIDASNPTNVLIAGFGIDEGEPISMKVKRNGQLVELKGNAKLNYIDGNGFKFTDESKRKLNQAWLKG